MEEQVGRASRARTMQQMREASGKAMTVEAELVRER